LPLLLMLLLLLLAADAAAAAAAVPGIEPAPLPQLLAAPAQQLAMACGTSKELPNSDTRGSPHMLPAVP
jgi:hypothetical protein